MNMTTHRLHVLRNSGAIQCVPSKDAPVIPGYHREPPPMSDEDRRRCRRGLKTLYRLLVQSQHDLARRGLKEIIIWDPDDENINCQLVFEGERAVDTDFDRPENFPSNKEWVKVRNWDMVWIMWTLGRPGGIDALVNIIGVRRMTLSYPPDVLKNGCTPGPLLSNHLGPDIQPNADYSIGRLGEIRFHS